jgi:hypothetical protein
VIGDSGDVNEAEGRSDRRRRGDRRIGTGVEMDAIGRYLPDLDSALVGRRPLKADLLAEA